MRIQIDSIKYEYQTLYAAGIEYDKWLRGMQIEFQMGPYLEISGKITIETEKYLNIDEIKEHIRVVVTKEED